jgi:hypothetical protein
MLPSLKGTKLNTSTRPAEFRPHAEKEGALLPQSAYRDMPEIQRCVIASQWKNTALQYHHAIDLHRTGQSCQQNVQNGTDWCNAQATILLQGTWHRPHANPASQLASADYDTATRVWHMCHPATLSSQ